MPTTVSQSTFLVRHLLRRGPLAIARVRGLIARERMAEPLLLVRRDRLLRNTLESARLRLPRYRDVPPCPRDANPATWLREHYPVIGKEDLKADRSMFYPNGGVRRRWWLIGMTSGTSGAPLRVFRSLDSAIWEEAFHMQAWHWAGHRAGDPHAVLRGDTVVPIEQDTAPYWMWDPYGRQLFVSTRHLTRATASVILDAIQARQVRCLRAYPSAAYELARAAEQYRHPLRLQAVITGSEPLFPSQREQIQRAFGCQVYDFYGMAERIAFAAQCEHGHYHAHPEYSYLEILDENDRATEGFGNLVGTTLHNHVMPLLRYRIADRARWLHGTCACGRTYPRIELSSGKVEDQLYDSDGNPVSAAVITFAVKSMQHISRTQVAQVGPGEWEVRVVLEACFTKADADRLLRNFRELVSKNVHVSTRVMEQIPLQPSGKFKWIAQEWPGASLLATEHRHAVVP